jgi:LAS superfamily LD-carboxypeptidase LdcB
MQSFKIIFFIFFISIYPNCGMVTAEEKETNEEIIQPIQTQTLIEKESKIMMDSSITLDYLLGKFDPKKNNEFIKVDQKHASKADFYLRKDTYDAFQKMYEVAKKDGIQLQIISATRPFSHQKSIWEAKWTGNRKIDGQDISKTINDPVNRALKILEYSSMPGTSRHHWGTDMDINALTNEYFDKGKGLKEYEWLVKNAAQFGFCQPYSQKGKDRPNGYNEEKWHWSYLPFAKKLTDQYKLRLNDESISGFEGAETATKIGVVEKYVLGINTECL